MRTENLKGFFKRLVPVINLVLVLAATYGVAWYLDRVEQQNNQRGFDERAERFLKDIEPGRDAYRLALQQATADIEAGHRTNSFTVILVAGTIIGLLSSLLLEIFTREGQRVEQRAKAITRELAESANRLRIAQNTSLFGTWEIDLNTDRVVWDDLMFDIYGLPRSAVPPSRDQWLEMIHAEDIPQIKELYQKSAAQQDAVEGYFRIKTPSGIRHIQARATLIADGSGRPVKIIGVNRDITVEVLARQKDRLTARVFQGASEGIVVTDDKLGILEVNQTFCDITEYSREEVLGKTPALLKSGVHPPDFYQRMWQALDATGHWSGEICNRKKSGEVYHELLHISRIEDDRGILRNYVGIFSDITHLKEHEKQLYQMATHDALTGLPNRAYLHHQVEKQMRRANSSRAKIGFLYVDIDNFKVLNDAYGHDTGDQYLKEVGRRLSDLLGAQNTVARIGGDEFVVVYLFSDTDELLAAAKNFIAEISRPFDIAGMEAGISLSASIGISVFPDDSLDSDTLLRQADQALYQAKQRGRGTFFLYDLATEQSIERRSLLLNDIQRGLHEGEFELFYQPKIDLVTNWPIGFEALIRWHHPEQGLLTPSHFIPATEFDMLSVKIGEWAIAKVVEQLAACREKGMDIGISVNISGRQLNDPRFFDFLKSLSDRRGYELMSKLEIEILESASLQNLDEIRQLIEQCRTLGITFAIDDFGTGYSSLTYIKQLPADTLKIDQSFIRDMLVNDDDMAIVTAVIAMAKTFGKKLVAEGVEETGQERILLQLGCDYAQGYLYSKPIPCAEACAWYQRQMSLSE